MTHEEKKQQLLTEITLVSEEVTKILGGDKFYLVLVVDKKENLSIHTSNGNAEAVITALDAISRNLRMAIDRGLMTHEQEPKGSPN